MFERWVWVGILIGGRGSSLKELEYRFGKEDKYNGVGNF